jgi:hypothetical protein
VSERRTSVNWWLVLVAIGLAVLLCLIVWLIISNSRKSATQPISPTSVMIVVPAPTLTPLPSPTPYYTPTPTQRPGLPPASEGIQIGAYVQILGTDGAGLRLRTGAGLNNDSKFLGMDAEVFEVKDGPVVADGITWWYLMAPYDETRSGWAASNYLQIVTIQPTETQIP